MHKSLGLMKKFVVGWALIGGMVVYTLLAGVKQLSKRLQADNSVTASSDEATTGKTEPHRFTGPETGVQTQSD